MNDKYSTTEGKTSEKLSDEAMLSAQWKNIDWHKAEREVNRLQIRIVKATQQKDYNAVKRLQYLLTHSFYAKALAVKRVVTNDGRRTPGVDGVLWNTPAKKMAAALSLTDKRYRARPLRRVYIEKKDKKKKRPLGIPTMYDRAMQALYALALEPVAETTADGKSFGFRKGRCAQDACEYLFNALSRKHISPKWVLEGDIKGCFDHISHDWLLANIPMDKNILKQFLKAGFIYQRELFPTEEGTPQGGIISPILANMTLDGIEKKLVERFHTNALDKVDSRFRTRPVYDAYRKSGYSKKFLEEHREQITLHKAAKAAFDESNLRTLPKVKELDTEYSKLLTEKKVRYPDYRKAKEEMQELLRAKRNVEMFFAEEKSIAEKMKSR